MHCQVSEVCVQIPVCNLVVRMANTQHEPIQFIFLDVRHSLPGVKTSEDFRKTSYHRVSGSTNENADQLAVECARETSRTIGASFLAVHTDIFEKLRHLSELDDLAGVEICVGWSFDTMQYMNLRRTYVSLNDWASYSNLQLPTYLNFQIYSSLYWAFPAK
eukprot:scaffold1736_cov127-Cylindrotheca_fusiformis.AAC.80